jgi:GT2 family glycosyltransferase
MVSVIIVNYNGRKYLNDCLSSVLAQSYGNLEVVLVDNCSSDGSVEYVEENFPQVKIVNNSKNLGYGGGNNVGFNHALGEYIAVLNPDTVVEKDWLVELVSALQRRHEAKMVTSKVLLYNDPERINGCGNDIHISGLVFSRGLFERKDRYTQEEYVAASSGCSFLVPRALIDEIGFFDTTFSCHWLYEDTDLAIRVQLNGYKCLCVPSSKVFHKFTLKMDAKRIFLLERGRYLLLLNNFSQRTLAVLLPSFLLTEMLTWGYVSYKGREFILYKILAYVWILKNWKKILKRRANTSELTAADKEIVKLMTWKISIPPQWSRSRILRNVAESFFNAFYSISYRIALSIII